jgi:hypothetical protein
MGRFVVFDQETIGKLPQDLRAVAELGFGSNSLDTLDYLNPIFQTNTESLVMIPTRSDGCVCVIHFRPVPKPEVQATNLEPQYEATGILGLSETLYELEPERPRRWWHWFWS